MQGAQRHRHVITLVTPTLILHRIYDHDRVHECRQQRLHGRIQVSELLVSWAVQLPSVHASDAEPGPDLFPGRSLPVRRQPIVSVGVHAGQELPLSLRVTPGIRLEPPAPDRLNERSQVALHARPLERRIQVRVVPLRPGLAASPGSGPARQIMHLPL